MIFQLSLGLVERLGLIVMFAFFMSKTALFKNYILKAKSTLAEHIFFAVLWGGLGIVMTVLGTPVEGGIANSRTIPIVLSGFIGGPVVGSISGLIAGVHRIFFTSGGELTALACGISTIMGGIIGGLSKKALDAKKHRWAYGFAVGVAIESLQMLIILAIAKPFDEALQLVQIIFIPMTFLNALGIGMFVLFVEQIVLEHENIAATKAEMALKIANQTLPYLKRGLVKDTALATAEIIYAITDFDAVAITDTEGVLVHLGAGADHHRTGGQIFTDITHSVLSEGQLAAASDAKGIGCKVDSCSLKSVVVAPLKMNERVVGTLKVYRCAVNGMTKSDIELAKGLGALFSTQLELASLETQKLLREKAELNALRAQIKPHFLFNALNAIISITRTDAERARELMRELSVFLRSRFKNLDERISLEEEIRFIEAYLNIEKARFPDKLSVEYDIDAALQWQIPPFLLQPLVENAVKHGIRNKQGPGTVKLKIQNRDGALYCAVSDDGIGFDPSTLPYLMAKGGVGLGNVSQRLKALYDTELHIVSERSVGTKITFKIPKNGGEHVDKSRVGG